jgi:hypothetical protein
MNRRSPGDKYKSTLKKKGCTALKIVYIHQISINIEIICRILWGFKITKVSWVPLVIFVLG